MIGGDNASESEWNRRSPGSVDDLDPEGFTLRLAAQTPHDFAPGDRRAGVGCAAVVSASNAQGSGVRHPKASVRVGSHGRRSRHSSVGGGLAALSVRLDCHATPPSGNAVTRVGNSVGMRRTE